MISSLLQSASSDHDNKFLDKIFLSCYRPPQNERYGLCKRMRIFFSLICLQYVLGAKMETAELPINSHCTVQHWHKSLLFSSSTYSLLTPWSRVLLEQLTGLQLVKKIPAFHGTRRFITALTIIRHLSLSWASLIQSIHPHPTSCRSILFLSNITDKTKLYVYVCTDVSVK